MHTLSHTNTCIHIQLYICVYFIRGICLEVESIEGKKPTQNYDDETTSKRNYVRPGRVGCGIWQKPNQAPSTVEPGNTTHSERDDGKEKRHG